MDARVPHQSAATCFCECSVVASEVLTYLKKHVCPVRYAFTGFGNLATVEKAPQLVIKLSN